MTESKFETKSESKIVIDSETKFEMPYENDEYTKYNPLHKELGITLNTNVKYEKRITYNKYEIVDKNGEKKECFKKFITLVDYVKFLIGKYKNENIQVLPGQIEETKAKHTDTKDTESKESKESKDIDESHTQSQSQSQSLFKEYINSYHNYAYVDSFYYYLTSKILEKGFVHGLEFYDSYICVSKECEIDIVDDFEYLCDSNFFSEKLNNQFYFKDENIGNFFNKKEPIKIDQSSEDITFEVEELDMNELEETEQTKEQDVEQNKETELEIEMESLDNISKDSNIDDIDTDDNSDIVGDTESEKSDDSDDSDDSNDSDDYETESDSDSDSDSGSENSKEPEKLILIIKNIPTQVIAIEKCEGTFDSLLENNELTMEELESALFQIIVMLYVYQNIFDFTHNDLHTNNIMFIHTEEEFLYYKVKEVYYKIPTFGKIYKIIDFGRSIYKVNNKLVCSDSFSQNGTAHTQYNFEPFYNKNKQIVEPNKSFDLCRLACSMIDFIIDDIKQIQKFREVPVYDLIISWLYDDNGINVLYKNNGEERYPDFKLYKMIARIVHNHTPENQFNHACFNKYKTTVTNKIMNIDELIKTPVHL
jgi:hypothetical protein